VIVTGPVVGVIPSGFIITVESTLVGAILSIVIVLVVGMLGFGIYQARKHTD